MILKTNKKEYLELFFSVLDSIIKDTNIKINNKGLKGQIFSDPRFLEILIKPYAFLKYEVTNEVEVKCNANLLKRIFSKIKKDVVVKLDINEEKSIITIHSQKEQMSRYDVRLLDFEEKDKDKDSDEIKSDVKVTITTDKLINAFDDLITEDEVILEITTNHLDVSGIDKSRLSNKSRIKKGDNLVINIKKDIKEHYNHKFVKNFLMLIKDLFLKIDLYFIEKGDEEGKYNILKIIAENKYIKTIFILAPIVDIEEAKLSGEENKND